MDMQQAITAKRTSEPSTKLIPIGARLDALGQLLYGEQWITTMARDLKIHPNILAEWAGGRRELPPDHPIFAALAVLVYHHDKGVAKACAIMDRESGLAGARTLPVVVKQRSQAETSCAGKAMAAGHQGELLLPPAISRNGVCA
jgi:hypothetical protein